LRAKVWATAARSCTPERISQRLCDELGVKRSAEHPVDVAVLTHLGVGAAPGEQHDGRLHIPKRGPRVVEQRKGEVRVLHGVEEDGPRTVTTAQDTRFLDVPGAHDLEALAREQLAQQVAQNGVLTEDQHGGGVRHGPPQAGMPVGFYHTCTPRVD